MHEYYDMIEVILFFSTEMSNRIGYEFLLYLYT